MYIYDSAPWEAEDSPKRFATRIKFFEVSHFNLNIF